jgi:hypothetical protein
MLRSLSGARAAFDKGDEEGSRLAHTLKSTTNIEEPGHDGPLGMPLLNYKAWHNAELGLAISMVFISAIAGAQVAGEILIQLGFPIIGVIALSFGAMEVKDELCLRLRYKRERGREQWELQNFMKGEKQEMVELYVQRGMGEEDATEVIDRMAKYEQFFIDIMMMEGASCACYNARVGKLRSHQ